MERENLNEDNFEARFEGEFIGGLYFTRSSYSSVRVNATSQTIRHQNNKSDSLFLNIKLSGNAIITANGVYFEQKVDDFVVYDTSSPYEVIHPEYIDQIVVEIPRRRLESMLGAAHNYTVFAIRGALPTATLLRSYLFDLLRVRDQLTPDAAERVSSVGVDVLIACIAEQMVLETPSLLRATVAVQRAKSYIEANLQDYELDPARVAAATNVSLRYLQEHFRKRGRHVAE